MQPIGKERIVNNVEQKRNRFELLRNMETYQLNRVMRNSVEIHNLVKLTTGVLHKQQTVFFHEVEKTMKSDQKPYILLSKISNIFRKKKTVMTVPDLGPDVTGDVSSKQGDPCDYPENNSSIPQLELDETKVNPESVRGIPYEDPLSIPRKTPDFLSWG